MPLGIVLVSDGGAFGNQSRLRSSAGSTAVYVTSDSVVRGIAQCRLDVSDHHSLHCSIFFDIEMVDTGHMLQVNILQHAAELVALADGVTKPVRDVVIYVAVDVS
jgi:hypothetical protein